MVTRCTLCRRPIHDESLQRWCRCGWCMDPNCERNHAPFCQVNGSERWIGALEY
ncbi:hypothetical protein [Natronobeatus ordinarius]|uniref:hypothetical protein n=1 Tax=Natronobeatus ordinarius TaxID=2963433 RepID=UPI0020CB9062|nr:hypothetical protein [Natronobeatus ordinarius]